MAEQNNILLGLQCHSGTDRGLMLCIDCPYSIEEHCSQKLAFDAHVLLKAQTEQILRLEKYVPFLAAHDVLKMEENDAKVH